MKLHPIDKAIYRKRYRQVFAAIVLALVSISLSTSTALIHWIGEPEDSNFSLNLVGVAVAVALVSWVVFHFRNHPLMAEVVYVWRLKQELNRIYRKQRHIEPRVEDNDADAITIMYFMFQGSKQLYELDDNTITLEDLALKAKALDARIESLGLQVDADDYSADLLDRF